MKTQLFPSQADAAQASSSHHAWGRKEEGKRTASNTPSPVTRQEGKKIQITDNLIIPAYFEEFLTYSCKECRVSSSVTWLCLMLGRFFCLTFTLFAIWLASKLLEDSRSCIFWKKLRRVRYFRNVSFRWINPHPRVICSFVLFPAMQRTRMRCLCFFTMAPADKIKGWWSWESITVPTSNGCWDYRHKIRLIVMGQCSASSKLSPLFLNNERRLAHQPQGSQRTLLLF